MPGPKPGFIHVMIMRCQRRRAMQRLCLTNQASALVSFVRPAAAA